MTKNENDINSLINKAIDASFKFEKKMDQIDFDSYLYQESTRGNFETYIKENFNYIQNKINILSKAKETILEILKNIQIAKQQARNTDQYDKQVEKATKALTDIIGKTIKRNGIDALVLCFLFIAKYLRLEARKQTIREPEKQLFICATHILHKAFDQLPLENFTDEIEKKKFKEEYNWAKVLIYNELSICYSGLTKSSMSHGYAMQTIALMEKLFPPLKAVKNWDKKKSQKLKGMFENTKSEDVSHEQIVKLFSFALCNKAEAERLLHDDDLALKSFRTLIDFLNIEKTHNKINCPDIYLAQLRKALILIDMGRGKEGEISLNDIKPNRNNKQYAEKNIEMASIYIDQKKYKDAYKRLKVFEKSYWTSTFAQRKAETDRLRLLNEFRKNMPECFPRDNRRNKNTDFSANHFNQKMVNEYKKFKEEAPKLLERFINEYDGNNFKKACTCLSEYFKQAYADKKKLSYIVDGLKYFYLYLLYEIWDGKDGKVTQSELKKYSNEDKKLDELLEYIKAKELFGNPNNITNNNDDDKTLSGILHRIEDVKFLSSIFDLYTACLEEEGHPDEIKDRINRDIREKLVARLEDLYQQNDKLMEAEKIKEKHRRFEEKLLGSTTLKLNGQCADFIKDSFFEIKNNKEYIRHDSIVALMRQNTKKFTEKVVGKSHIHDEKEDFSGRLCVLRRWNSFTPALQSSVDPSKGGGYFLHFSYKDDTLGIVIDPGYDFLDNFFSQGFRIGDIDAVLVSHAHPDHTNNLPSVLSLFHEMNDRLGEYHNNGEKKNKKHLTLVLSPGVFEHYNRIVDINKEVLKDIIIVNIQDNKNDNTSPLELKSANKKITADVNAFATSHSDLSQSQSLGFTIETKINGETARIGYTGDARWNLNKNGKNRWSENLERCSIVCAHLGSIVNILDKKDFCITFCEGYTKQDNDYKCEKWYDCRNKGFSYATVNEGEKLINQTRDENHLYLAGLTALFHFLKKDKKNQNLQIAIISEFGEELKHGIRMDLFKKFDDWFGNKNNVCNNGSRIIKKRPRCLPGDIGLEIDVFNGNVYCHCCNRFIERDRIEPIPYGKEEAICFVCKDCTSTLSPYQIGEMLKKYCESGRTRKLVET